jgi:hypothetical protein
MAIVTVYAGASGDLTEVVFGSPEAREPSGDHGDGAGGASPYAYLLMALGA